MTKKPKYAAIIRKDRINPQIGIYYTDGTLKTKSIRVDLNTAEAFIDQLNREIVLGIFREDKIFTPGAQKTTLLDLKNKYLEYREKEVELKNISSNSLVQDNSAFYALFLIFGEKTKLNTFTKESVKQFQFSLLNHKSRHNRNYSPASVNSYMKHLSGAFSFAIEQGWIDINPFREVPKLKYKPTKHILTQDEIIAFRDYFRTKPRGQLDAFNFAIWTGCREQTIINLKREDIKITMYKGKVRHFVTLHEKGNKTRPVPLLFEPLQLLKDRIEILDNNGLIENIIKNLQSSSAAKALKRAEEGFIFFEFSRRDSITGFFARARKKINLKDITFHDLRKSFATYFIEATSNPIALQRILGHESFKTTEKAYLAERPEFLFDAMDNFTPA